MKQKTIAALALVALASPMLLQAQSATATVTVFQTTAFSWSDFRPSHVLVREGNPTAQQIQAFVDGGIRFLEFTTTNPNLVSAYDSDAACTSAIDFACEYLGDDIRVTRHDQECCVGSCMNGVGVQIKVE